MTGLLTGLPACNPDGDMEAPGVVTPAPTPDPPTPEPEPPDNNRLRITAGGQTFTATLQNNASVRAFEALLPMTVRMNEMNGNEKYYNLTSSLPAAAASPGTIHTGDLMLWGSNTLVLFYQTFTTSYGYTRLGRIDNPSDLIRVLGTGSVEVRFETGQ